MTNINAPILTLNSTRYVVHRFRKGSTNRLRNLRFNGMKYVPFYRHASKGYMVQAYILDPDVYTISHSSPISAIANDQSSTITILNFSGPSNFFKTIRAMNGTLIFNDVKLVVNTKLLIAVANLLDQFKIEHQVYDNKIVAS